MDRGTRLAQQFFEPRPPLGKRPLAQIVLVDGEEVETDERGGRTRG